MFKSKRKKLAADGVKKKDAKRKGALSFGYNDDDNDGNEDAEATPPTTSLPSRSSTPATHQQQQQQDTSTPTTDSEQTAATTTLPPKKKRLVPSTSVAFAPKAQTKASLLREAHLKESLRKEYALVQEAVRQTEFLLPFTFFDGKSMPGGACRMKKGDPIWLFLERARKVGAAGGDKSRKDWARIGVDDLMVVRGEVVIPHVSVYPFLLTSNRYVVTKRKMTALRLPLLPPQPQRRLHRPTTLPVRRRHHQRNSQRPPPTKHR